MGVTGLWSVVAPTARPTKLETLNRKRLAVDASIWIYQFLKAVRDKEGNALRNSHVVGFFRRICKLLYFGILPIFVFDGGAPGLKRETIRKRQRRREGRREDASRTAGKLLAVQVARAAEDEDRRRRETRRREETDVIQDGEDLIYVEEIGMSKSERHRERAGRFKRKDQYHLPDLDISLEAMGAPNDPRIMSQAELEEYAQQFHSGEDINLYDFSKIDFESPFFLSLPAGDRYNILNAARLRSRLRMGYSKEQLDGMFPDRMAFSRFQIERVKERNELTQRLMHINGMNEEWSHGGRIAGEKGKEYILVKNDGVEGGWALGVVSNKQGTQRDDAIDVDDDHRSGDDEPNELDSEEDFEDVAIEGLNRLPTSLRKSRKNLQDIDYDVSYEQAAEEIAQKRKAVYGNRTNAPATGLIRPSGDSMPKSKASEGAEPKAMNDLFVAQDCDDEDVTFEDVKLNSLEEEDDELQRAIAMSLEKADESTSAFIDRDQAEGSEQQASEEEDDLDLTTVLAESRRSQRKSATNSDRFCAPDTKNLSYGGPLPFESINLGHSLLGQKKAKKIEEDMSGGFDKEIGEDAFRKPRKPQPLPSWFKASAGDEFAIHEHGKGFDDHVTYGREDVDRRRFLGHSGREEIIDLEAPELENINGDEAESVSDTSLGAHEDVEQQNQSTEIYLRESSLDLIDARSDDNAEQEQKSKAAQERNERYKMAREIAAESPSDDHDKSEAVPIEGVPEHIQIHPSGLAQMSKSVPEFRLAQPADPEGSAEPEHEIDWSHSEEEPLTSHAKRQIGLERSVQTKRSHDLSRPQNQVNNEDEDEDEDETFENVEVDRTLVTKDNYSLAADHLNDGNLTPLQDNGEGDYMKTNPQDDVRGVAVDDYLSESEEELMRQLALEAEGHAEFASLVNQVKTPAQAQMDYENELKQLRNQQKKDRRDADEVTQVMVQECQALLRLFGLPYITAPMEAEAQCAELVHLGLVDGIVTDDSDIFLFGGTRIYKNMFNAAKFVECYVSQDLEKEYDLDRIKLIRFAHLLGSDYTEGIPGIGPVTALEIISDFVNLDDFRDWCSKIQLGRPHDLENELSTPFRRKFKKTAQKRLFLSPAFPDQRVDYAYLNPEVDSNPEGFQWGVPDLDKLRSFLMSTIGWTQDRTDEILVPVIRDMNRRHQEGTQANITRFFAGSAGVGAAAVEGAAPRNKTGKESGRMKNAYARLRGEARRKRLQSNDAESADDEGESSATALDEDETHDSAAGSGKRKTKRSKIKN